MVMVMRDVDFRIPIILPPGKLVALTLALTPTDSVFTIAANDDRYLDAATRKIVGHL